MTPLNSPLIDVALAKMKKAIVCCELRPGEKLKVAELSKVYGLSSSPIREALNRLTQDGVVEASDNKGFRVAAISEADFREITRLRCLLEGEALSDAIRFGDDEWEANVLGAFHRLNLTERKLDSGPLTLDEEWSARHKAFHFALFSACPSPLMLRMIDSLFDRAERYRRFSAKQRIVERHKGNEHQELMEASLARDSERAVTLLRNHIQNTLGRVIEALEKQRATLQ
ncbi:GntR family transcriptional regulator [Pseudomonas monteilii]|uniref:GntR family transcriptional regulator n=1 Tax=Pseudomonas monteilii TaxID=76759 RepID=UPI003F6E3C57